MAKGSDKALNGKVRANGANGNGSAANLGFEAKLWLTVETIARNGTMTIVRCAAENKRKVS